MAAFLKEIQSAEMDPGSHFYKNKGGNNTVQAKNSILK